MKERSFDIEVVLSPGKEQHGGHPVDENADRRDANDGQAGDFFLFSKTSNSLPSDPTDGHQRKDGVRERSQNGAPPEPVGVPGGRLALGQPAGSPS